ncbi:uncharacterized protein LOC106154847 [Lingula anatina]|uniref:Uncharacterized protein LOC106154847 n=1 Tax=Lingula anatina TaxID=7574 RepID=A0A1S3HFJ4_LINAN|nr:uncharacterized protein LOC106154847 [Lingula anatina]|eukprot:XP_013384815.1 uncharacterized protein LOC106154847 [Lingula anatina]
MPQITNRKLVRDTNNCPIGKGSVFNSVLDISFAARRRAEKLNEGEAEKFKMVNKVMEKYQHSQEVINNRAIERINKSLREMEAYKRVLQSDYRANHFDTLKLGYKPGQSKTPENARKVKYETRVYNSGFSLRNFRPEVERKLKEMDPEEQASKFKQKLLEKFRRQSEVSCDNCRRLSVASDGNFRSRRVSSLPSIFGAERQPPIRPDCLDAIETVQNLNNPDRNPLVTQMKPDT